ncbi:MAG: hypothetical protein E6I88_04580 [Chloroflexi bacterium]|nr:MAG: hypothetical protein E6I88_04580 [Chloroflexota bacterium]TME46216.1 MAG: hypothetical protein E6I56_07750 [Chloroflexota bacterium]
MALEQNWAGANLPTAFPGLSEAQFGTVAEDRLATAIVVKGSGTATVAFPLLDLGFDLYLRRVRTLRVHPLQVKARSFLEPDEQFQVGVVSLHPDPRGYVVFPYVPPPDWQLAPALWAMPIPAFIKLARPHDDGYVFSGWLDRRLPGPADDYLVELAHLDRQWLHRIPGWAAPVHARDLAAESTVDQVGMPATRAFGKFGELWLASQLTRAGLQDVVIAQDRLSVDCVDFVLHDLRSFAMLGLVVHTGTVNSRGVVQFRIRADTFFTDARLDVVFIVCESAGDIAAQSFVIPSSDVSRITTSASDRGVGGYQASFRLDPLAEKMRPYAVPTEDLAATILRRLRR